MNFAVMMSFVLLVLIVTNRNPTKPEQSSQRLCQLSRLSRLCTKIRGIHQGKPKHNEQLEFIYCYGEIVYCFQNNYVQVSHSTIIVSYPIKNTNGKNIVTSTLYDQRFNNLDNILKVSRSF